MRKKGKDRSENERIYRFWVEIRDLRDGSSRSLPLRVMKLVYLGGKQGAPPKPDEQVLRLQDDGDVIEAKDIDELAAKLRSRYPNETHERRLHWERDLEAEHRYAAALQSLIELLVEAAVNDILREEAAERRNPPST